MKDLPVKSSEEFLAEIEVMDLSYLKDGKFVVAVGTGDPKGFKLLGSTIHGPYDFVEMVQEVGDMWNTHQHHAKVIKLSKAIDSVTEMLDENTVDYIECHYNDIITEEMLGGAFDDKEFTCKAGLVMDDGANPLRQKQEEKKEPKLEDEDALK